MLAKLDRASGSGRYLVDLPPLLRRFFCEALVDHGHNLVQQLTATVSDHVRYNAVDCVLVEGPVGDLLHQGRGCTCF